MGAHSAGNRAISAPPDSTANLVTPGHDPAATPPNGIPNPVQYFELRIRPFWLPVLVFGAVLIAALAAVGGDTVTHHIIAPQPLAQTTRPHAPVRLHGAAKPTPTPTVTYDLAGYLAALSGPQEATFSSALAQLAGDVQAQNYLAMSTDGPKLVSAANAWLGALKQTNPPPADLAARASYEHAARLARQAAHAIRSGLQTGNNGKIASGGSALAQAQRLLPNLAGS